MKMKLFVIVITLSLLLSGMLVAVGGEATDGGEGEVNKSVEDEPELADLANSPWPMFGGGLNNDGRTEVAANASTDELRWNFTAKDSIDSSPVIGPEGNIFVGSADGHLYSLSPEGKKRWSFNVSFLFSIKEDTEVIADNLDDQNISDQLRKSYEEENHSLSEDEWISISVVEKGEVWEIEDEANEYNHKIRKENGKLNIYDASISIDSTPAVDAEGNVYFGDTEGHFYSLDSDGTERWSKDLGKDVNSSVSVLSSPVVTDNGSVLIGRDFSMLYSFYTRNGTKRWEYNPGGKIGSTPAVDEDGRIYLGIGIGFGLNWGRVEALSPEGEPLWNYTIKSENSFVFSSPALDSEGNVYFGSHDGNLYSLDSNGQLNWKYETGDIVFSSPSIGADGTIYVGSSDNHLYAIGEDGEKKWRYKTGDRILGSPSIGSSGNIYFGSMDGRLYSLTPDGEERWNFETDGYIASSPAIDGEGNLYFGSADHNLYSLKNGDTDYTILSTLTINIEGEGTIEVDGVEVENGWTQEYVDGTEVTLEAIPDENWTFNEWTGNDETGEEITITINEDKEITAHFKEEDDDGIPGIPIPGFTSLLLLVASIIAVSIYQKKDERT